MTKYNFSTLNDKDFEELARDLLTVELGAELHSYKRGRDYGIDLRYSTPQNNNSIVVQVKHYPEPDFSSLLSSLKKERVKLDKLDPAPERYIIVTSQRLLPQYEDQILDLFTPYMSSASEIYGNEQINHLLDRFPEIELRHFKLWLTSINVMKSLLDNSLSGRSKFYETKILNDIRKYVETPVLDQCLEILQKHRYLLITGQPGVGKSTLAQMIIYRLLGKGYHLSMLEKDISEGEKDLEDPGKKVVFYLDDFLGANYYDIHFPKSSESSIISFLERVSVSENKFLILTTRTTILNTAKQRNEKLGRSNLEIARKEVDVGAYTDMEKAQILYNHLYFSNLEKRHIVEVFRLRNYWKIIKHKNYNPRIIEFITDSRMFIASGNDQYFNYVMSKLDRPEDIWRHSFENQITEEDRLFLMTLFTFKGEADESNFQQAFDARIIYEIKNNGYTKPINVYNSCLKRLLDGHISRYYGIDGSVHLKYVNPSLGDFMIGYYLQSVEERRRLIESMIFFEQLENVFESVIKKIRSYQEANSGFWFVIDFLERVQLEVMDDYFQLNRKNASICKKISIYSKIWGQDEIMSVTDKKKAELFGQLELNSLDSYRYISLLAPAIEDRNEDGLVDAFCRNSWESLTKALWKCVLEKEDAEIVIGIINDFSSYRAFLNTADNRWLVYEIADYIARDTVSSELYSYKKSICNSEEFEEMKAEMEERYEAIMAFFELDEKLPDEVFDDFNEELFSQNRERANLVRDSITKPDSARSNNFDEDIDALFARFKDDGRIEENEGILFKDDDCIDDNESLTF